MALFLQTVMAGISVGAVDALLALGIVLVFRVTHVLNFAQAATATVAGYVCYSVSQHAGGMIGVSAAIVAGAAIGTVTGLITRGMRGRDRALVAAVATLAIAILLEQVVRIGWGSAVGRFPALVASNAIPVGGVTITALSLASVVVALLLASSLGALLRFSKAGAAIRAVADDADQARLCGAPARALMLVMWAAAGALAAVASLFPAQIVFDPSYMDPYFVTALIAAVLGGLRSLTVTFAGAVALEIARNLFEAYAPGSVAVYADTALIVLLILVLALAPRRWLVGQSPRQV